MMDPSSMFLLAKACVFRAPLEVLSSRLQMLDHAGNTLAEFHGGLVEECQRRYFTLVHPSAEVPGQLQPASDQIQLLLRCGPVGHSVADVMDECFRASLSISSQIWA
eukprot:1988977-Alexandrium_andersonii.AAC.1